VLYDFHTHTFHSDGALSPIELIHRAFVKGYTAIAITDHLALGSLSRVIRETSDDCALARKYWDILAIPGVELTHLPPEAISDTAQKAKESGAWLVVVHGESPIEPVPKGTNLAAVQSPYVDILAHPGLITPEEAALAAQNDIFIELSNRRGHCTTNHHVASICQKLKARLLVNSDAHDEDDLLTPALAKDILNKSGLSNRRYQQVLRDNPVLLLDKIKKLGFSG
jgi:histidinol phosphatase-like PHP family hydrolase